MYRKKIFSWIPIIGLSFLLSCGSGDDLQIIFLPPNVLETSPVEGESGVPLNTPIIITFDQDIEPSSLTDSSFFLMGPSGSVAGTITYSASELSATLQPEKDLEPAKYTAAVTNEIQSIHGVPLGNPHKWKFTTGNQADTEAPDFKGLLEKPKIKNSGTITLTWEPAEDNLDEPDQIVYEICYTLDFGGFCPDLFDTDLVEKEITNPGVSSFDLTGLFPGIQYFFLVRAKDRAQNLDSNRVEQSAIIDITQGRLYVSNTGASEVLAFDNPSALNGDVQADAKIRTQSGTLGNPNGLFVDEANDRLYVANFLANSIVIYENLSSLPPPPTEVYPSRIISGTSTTLNGPTALYVDLNDTNGTLYVANINTNTISVFQNASLISGNVSPNQTVSGDQTLLDNPLGMIVDGDQIYIANANSASILIFLKSQLQNGLNEAPPYLEIKGNNTNLSGPIGLALHSSYLIVGSFGNNSISLFNRSDISSCTPGTSCNPTPSKIIIGNSTGLNEPRGILLSTANHLFVSNGGDNLILDYNLNDSLFQNASGSVDLPPSVFPEEGSPDILGPRGLGLDNNSRLYVASQDADSIVAFDVRIPFVNTTVIKIESIQWTLTNPLGVYLDTNEDELYVTNFNGDSLMVFENPNSIGNNYIPTRIISGDLTQFNALTGIFVDEKKDTLYVANFDRNVFANTYILVFDNASTLRGNVAPSLIIRGTVDNITSPISLFVGPHPVTNNDILYVLNRGNAIFGFLPSIILIDLAQPTSLARKISGPSLSEPIGMSIDLTNNLMYVANRSGEPSIAGGNILVYDEISLTLGGDVAPKRSIQFHDKNTNFIPIRPNGITVQNLSPTQNRVYFANEGTVVSFFPGEDNPIPPSVIIFEDEITSFGDIRYEPSGIIQIGNTPDFNRNFPNQPYGIAADINSGTIHVADFRSNALFVFSDLDPLPSGETVSPIPSAEIPIKMRGPRWLALDLDGDELFVSSYDTNSIMSFRDVSQITGDTIPLRIIRGKNSKINKPQGILLVRNQDSDRLYVANEATRSILVFDDVRSARGDTPPTFEIKSTAFNSSELRGLAFSQKHDLLYVADKTGKIDIFENVSQLTASSDTSGLTPILTLENFSINQPIGLYIQEVGLTQNDDPLLAGKNSLYITDFGNSMVLVFDLELMNTVDAQGTIISRSLFSTTFRTIESNLPVQFSPVGIFVLEGLDHLYVSSIPTQEGNQILGESSILVFDKASISNGMVTPIQYIVGDLTGLQSPFGIVVSSLEFLPDLEKTRVVANPSMVAADGIEESTITVTALDAMNNPFPGVSIVLSSNSETVEITQPTTLTDSNGQVTGSVSSNTPEEAIIYATVSGLARAENTATVTFSETQP